MSSKRRLDHDRIIQLSAQGYAAEEICRIVGGKCKGYIQDIIRGYQRMHPEWSPGINSDKEGIAPLDVGKVKALHNAGWSIQQICGEFSGDYPAEEIRKAILNG